MAGHHGPLVADFHRYYGRSLASMTSWGIPLHEVADMAAYLPPDSACRRSLDEHWQRTPEIDLLREVEHNQRILVWQQTKDGSRGVGYPEPMRLPWDEPAADVMRGDVMTLEEADDFLGWDRLKAERGIA